MYTTQQANLVSAYGGFFQQWAWDHYATLTFAHKRSQASCLQHWAEFIYSLGQTTRGRVGWVRADEKRWSGYSIPGIPLHFHVLLKYKNVPAPKDVAAVWKAKAGNALVEPYCSGGGAAYYIAKMIPYEGAGYEMGGLEHFPCSEDAPIRGSNN